MASFDAMRQYLAAAGPPAPAVEIHLDMASVAEAFRAMFGTPDGQSLRTSNSVNPRP